MAYSRRTVKDYETIMNKDLYDNLQDGIDEALDKVPAETVAISTYSALSQIGLEEGTETVDAITMALPEDSKLQMKVTENHNTDIYPNEGSEGLLVAKKAGNCCKLEFTDAYSPAKWLCVCDIVTNESGEEQCVFTDWYKISVDSEHNLKTYSTLEQLGLTTGSETIASIASSLLQDGELSVDITALNASIYPANTGHLVVFKGQNKVTFDFTSDTSLKWTGIYDTSTSTFSEWKEVALAENLTVTSNTPLFFSITSDGILQVTYDDGN